ncbi:MAG: superoxide dismutase family protein [Sphingobium sp.]|nr:superoxide dismutase family protein [Sphingobium sp.]
MTFRPRPNLKVGMAVLPLLALPLATAASAQQNAGIAYLQDAQGKSVGKITLVGTPNGLSGTIDVKGLPPGEHGMHIHAVGKCSGTAFADAGAHLNPGGKQHGLDNPMGSHMGDLPVLKVGADGKAKQYVLIKAGFKDLLDTDGAAFVIHASTDDQKTDPSGNSGARIACGVFDIGAAN